MPKSAENGKWARASAAKIPPWRMPAFYFIHFFGVGVTLPFLNVYYHAVGMEGLQLGLLNAAPRLANALAPPLMGALADKFRIGRELVLLASLAGAAVALGMWGVAAFAPLLVLVTLYNVLRGPVVPVAENLCLRELRETGGQYGRVRWWGSLGFIVAALGVGRLIDASTLGAMFPVLAIAGVTLAGVASRLPRERGGARPRFRANLAALLRSRPLLIFLVTTILVAVSAGPFGVYFSIHLKRLGFSAEVIGLAWTVGVVSEIFFLFSAERIRRRFGLKAMLAAGMFASALRWEMVTWTEVGALLVAIQALHGITFGVFHAAAVHYIDRLSGPATKNTAQSLYNASTFGIGSTAGALLAGWLLPSWGFFALLHAGAALALLAGGAFVALAPGADGGGPR